MSGLKKNYPTKIYCHHGSDGTPFVYATLTDFEPGKGLLQIHSDWGTYSHYWGSMGDCTLREFLLETSVSYIEGKLAMQMNRTGKKESYAKLAKFIAQCWPKVKQMLNETNPELTEERSK